jgi:processive 1,2-diacylglycerol beta-glucosyltransferase
MSRLRKKLNFRLIGIITDIYPNLYWIYKNVDYYIVSTDKGVEYLLNKGINKENILDIGIPLSSRFFNLKNKEFLFKKLNLDEAKRVILIMGGYFGIGPIKRIIKALIIDPIIIKNYQIVVIAGKNKRLMNKLAKLKKKLPVFTILGFIDNVDEYMKVADILFTKPGGITLSEALTVRILTGKLNIVLITPIPGQEERNAKYLQEKKAVVLLPHLKKKKIQELVKSALLNDNSPYKIKDTSLATIEASQFLDILAQL